MKIYNLTRNLTQDEFIKLIKLQYKFGNLALVINKQKDFNQNPIYKKIQQIILGNLITKAQINKWPGTELLGNDYVEAYFFSLNEEFLHNYLRIIENCENSNCDYPYEDLCFLRSDNTEWFVSITHENDSYFLLNDEEYLFIINELPFLKTLIQS